MHITIRTKSVEFTYSDNASSLSEYQTKYLKELIKTVFEEDGKLISLEDKPRPANKYPEGTLFHGSTTYSGGTPHFTVNSNKSLYVTPNKK